MSGLLDRWIAADGTEIPLDGSTGVTALRGAAGLDGPPMANTFDPRIGDGAVLVRRRRSLRSFLLPLLIDETAVSTAEVVAAFQGPGRLVATSGRELQEVVYEGGLEGTWSIDTGGVDGLNHRKFPVSLVALDPFWKGSATSASGTFTAGTAWDAAISWDEPIPWNGGSSQQLVNDGDVATPVTVVVRGAADQVTMSLEGVSWQTAAGVTIPSNDFLTVNGVPDGRRGPHRGPHGQFAGADGPIDWSLLTESSQIFDLPPGNSSLIFSASGTDANTEWHVFWRPNYLTP